MKTYLDSPVGVLQLEATEMGLTRVYFSEHPVNRAHSTSSSPILRQTKSQLQEYFAGTRTTFHLPLAPQGTPFEKKVWHLLQSIGFGQTVTYLQLAKKLGNSNKVRAVGRANGHNPLAIIIPCHRVIGAGDKLTGYSGGVENKRWLLQHEGFLLL